MFRVKVVMIFVHSILGKDDIILMKANVAMLRLPILVCLTDYLLRIMSC